MKVRRRNKAASQFGLRCFIFLWAHCVSVTSSLASGFGFHFVTWPSWQVVTAGQEITLGCSTNLPPDTIRWQHNHRFIDAQNRSDLLIGNSDARVLGFSPSGSHLVLKVSTNSAEQERQEGLYQCVARVGSIAVTSLPGRVEAAFLKDYPQESQSTQLLLADAGEAFKVSCRRPESLPKATLQYYQDGTLIDLANGGKYHTTEDGSLVIVNATATDEGTFSCRAYNSYLLETVLFPVETKVSIKATPLKSSDPGRPPRLISFDSIINARQGDRVHLLCIAVGNVADLFWMRKESKSLVVDGQQSKALSLVIREVTVSNQGVYRCYGNNSQSLSSIVDVTLYVNEPPYIITGPDSQSIAEGSAFTLECVFGGNPAPTIAWVFNGALLTNSDTVQVTENRLELISVEKGQAGIYQCFAFNPFGSAQETAVVTVIPKTITAPSSFSPPGLPAHNDTFRREIDVLLESEQSEEGEKAKKKKRKKNKKKNKTKKFKKYEQRLKTGEDKVGKMAPPTRPNITKISDESVMVTWDLEPGNDTPISFFKVQYKILAGPGPEPVNRRWRTIDEDIDPHVKSVEVTGLKTLHIYKFRVVAVFVNNEIQPSGFSEKFFLEKEVKLQKPEKSPEILFLFPMDDQSLTVFWDYSAITKTEGFIIYYRETTSAADYTKVTLLGAQRRNYTVTHLKPHRSYDFKMTSFNMAGTSAFSKRKIYHAKGDNRTTAEGDRVNEKLGESYPVVPIVTSDPEMGISSRLLYITLGAGLGALLLIVIVSYSIYSCRNKNAADLESSDNKFMDASLRIHRLSVGDVRRPTQNGCQCAEGTDENQAPLLSMQRNVLKNNEKEGVSKNTSPSLNLIPKKSNGSVNILKETSFDTSEQPPNMYSDTNTN